MFARIIGTSLLFSVLTTPVFAASRSNISGALIVASYDNIANAELDVDKRKDVVTELQLAYRDVSVIRPKLALSYGANLKQLLHNDFDLLDQTSFEFELGLSYKRENAFSAPSYSISLNLGQSDSKVDTRDVIYYRVGLAYAKRVTDRVRFRLGIESFVQEAKEDLNGQAVFDVEQQRIYSSLDYKLGRRNTL